MRETGADVLGLDWRVPLDEGWRSLDYACAVQGNLDPITLFAEPELIRKRVHQILAQAAVVPDTSSISATASSPKLPSKMCKRSSSSFANIRTSRHRHPRFWEVLVADRYPEKTAVLLLAHGTPETLDDIPAYLRNVVSGRPMPDHVVEEIRHRYALIGKSPLTEITMLQGQLLSEKIGLPVYVGMRNWKPYIADVVKQMRADGITSAAAICLAPQNSRTSVGLYRRAAFAEAATPSRSNSSRAGPTIRCSRRPSPTS